MCVIVDTNTFGPVFDPANEKHAEFKLVLDWVLHGKGKFVIGGSKYMGELRKARRYSRIISILKVFKDKIIKLDDAAVDKEQKRIEGVEVDPDFDDPHLPAMVIVSKCQVICSVDNRSVRFVTNPKFYPDNFVIPKFFTGSRNKDLLSDKYIDKKYKPLNKIPKKEAENIEEKISSSLGKQSKYNKPTN